MSTQIVMEFVRHAPASEETMDELADATLDALNRDARFVAFGPVVSADYARSAIEVEFTVCTAPGVESEVDERIKRVGEIVRDALVTADYSTSVELLDSVPA